MKLGRLVVEGLGSRVTWVVGLLSIIVGIGLGCSDSVRRPSIVSNVQSDTMSERMSESRTGVELQAFWLTGLAPSGQAAEQLSGYAKHIARGESMNVGGSTRVR